MSNVMSTKSSFLAPVKAPTLRRVLSLVSGAVLTSLISLGMSLPVLAQEGAVADLMGPGPLPDLVLGSVEAPVVIVEYASMTCGACANFHNTVFPDLKKKYIDTGKVRFILREFPLDDIASGVSMLARCVPSDQAHPVIELFFATQESWAIEGDVLPKLFEVAKQAGFTKETFEACLANQKLLDDVKAVRSRGKTFGVSSTPSFFINGKKYKGAPILTEFDKVIEPLLPKN